MGEAAPPVRLRARPAAGPVPTWTNGSAVFDPGAVRKTGRDEDSPGFLGRVQRTGQPLGSPGAYEVWRWQSGAYQRLGLAADFTTALGLLR